MKYAPVPESAVMTLGGYTCFKPKEWDRYLEGMLFKHHPEFAARRAASRWETNDCILTSLTQYLLFEFGILLPRETLFQVYNEDGGGVLPRNLVAAISAVIEPLGLEIDRIVVPNEILRDGLNCPEKVMDLCAAPELDGHAGVAMINIEEGYSHAFFWQSMQSYKFSSPQFRLALTVRRIDGARPAFSALGGLTDYASMVRQFSSAAHSERVEYVRLLEELDDLLDYTRSSSQHDCPEFRADFDRRLSALLKSFSRSLASGTVSEEARSILSAGEAVRSIFRESPAIL